MAQTSPSNPGSLPGIVTDQPEIYESEPALSDDTGVNDLDLMNEPNDEAIAVVEVPINQAFAYFAERENEIAKFYVQRYGEYKISGRNLEDESDIEKYHRLVSEVNELMNKFQAASRHKSDGVLGNVALASNLEILSKQLKALEFAAQDGSMNPNQAGFLNIKDKLKKLGEKVMIDGDDEETGKFDDKRNDTSRMIRVSGLERRLNMLETLLGFNEERAQSLFKTTKCDNLIEVADTLSSWLSMFRPENVQRVNREVDYITQKLEKINEQSSLAADNKLEQLFNMVTATDKHRAMLPTIIRRLKTMEELQERASDVSSLLRHLQRVQMEIVDSLQSNKDELASLNDMFNKNVEIVGEISKDIDQRIASINKDRA